MPRFIALDGEGYTRDTGHHIFNLLGDSLGGYILDNDGLSTRTCFEYLLNLKTDNPDATFISFYFSYDVNKILRDLSRVSLMRLAAKDYVYLPDKRRPGVEFFIEYNPKKMFTLSEVWKQDNGKYKTIRSVLVYDVFGFFQTSFQGALKQFGVGDAEELKFIETMKAARGSFTTEQIEEVIRYNQMECVKLVELMSIVADRFYSVGINLSRWYGAGAVAGKVLEREKIKKHLYTPEDEDSKHAVMSAYFGGRVQCLKIGKFTDVNGYDINSAYPSAMAELASLNNAYEERISEYEDYAYTVYKVRWKVPKTAKLTPFPFRNPNGTIEYPHSGTGWYWQPEVKAALDVFGTGAIEILEGVKYVVQDETSRPFSFILDMYAHRKRLKKTGDMAQLCLKLALNSLYGKMAQGLGRRGKTPPFQCYIYAGLITAITRSKMLRVAATNPESVISFATDGILSREPLDVPEGTELGTWESAKYERVFIVKPGFYELRAHGKKPLNRVRGFPARNVDFGAIEEVWDAEGLTGYIHVPTVQFIGLKSSSATRPHGQWLPVSRKLSFYPSRGTPEYIEGATLRSYQILQALFKEGDSAPYFKGIHAIEDARVFADLEYFADDLD